MSVFYLFSYIFSIANSFSQLYNLTSQSIDSITLIILQLYNTSHLLIWYIFLLYCIVPSLFIFLSSSFPKYHLIFSFSSFVSGMWLSHSNAAFTPYFLLCSIIYSSKYLSASSSVFIPFILIFFINLSCNVLNNLSILHFHSGLLAYITFTPIFHIPIANLVLLSSSNISSPWFTLYVECLSKYILSGFHISSKYSFQNSITSSKFSDFANFIFFIFPVASSTATNKHLSFPSSNQSW